MLNVVIFCGGVSVEHEISIRSAKNVIMAMDQKKYKPILVIVSKSGTWYLQNDVSIIDRIKECVEPFAYGEVVTLIRRQNQTLLLTINSKKIKVDVAFPVLHGTLGEDGTLQGFLESVNLAYVGCNVLSSAIGMDKDITKRLWDYAGLPIVPYVCFNEKTNYLSYNRVCEKLNSTTLFIKPAIIGSSVGAAKVKSEAEYNLAVLNAFKYGNKIIVEKYIKCREIECAVLGNKHLQASCLGEIVPTHEFYSYEAKYVDPNGAALIVPAQLDNDVVEIIRELAIKACEVIESRGMARVDFFISNNNEIFINEINTIPGFTSISMYPKLWEESGISYAALISNLLELAIEEHDAKQKIIFVEKV